MDNQKHEQTIEINEDSLVLSQFVINDYGIIETAVLAFLIKQSNQQNTEDGWFSVTTEEITSNLNISSRILKRVLLNLQASPFIHTKKTWFPTRTWYIINSF